MKTYSNDEKGKRALPKKESPKEITKEIPSNNEEEIIIGKVLQKVKEDLQPRIDDAFKKVQESFRTELQVIRSEIQKPTPNITKSAVSPQAQEFQKTISDLAPQLQGMLGGLPPANNNNLVAGGGGAPQMNGMIGLIELMKALKGMEGGGTGAFNQSTINELMFRNQVNQMNSMNNLQQAIIKDFIKKSGGDESIIQNMEMTNEELMGKLTKLGVNEKIKREIAKKQTG